MTTPEAGSTGEQSTDVQDDEPLDGGPRRQHRPRHLPLTSHTVLDLPQLYQRPPFYLLLATLDDLSFTPPSWAGTSHGSAHSTNTPKKREIKGEGVPAYLTKIIGSPLSWIDDDAIKEQIWERAAQRLSERSGRTGMGDITRVFEIPLRSASAEGIETDRAEVGHHEDMLRITLHEPALSEDSLGLKTWAASYLLAKRLSLMKSLLPATPTEILELGAGTGLVGLVAAAVFKCPVLQTDLPAIVPNLERNAHANSGEIEAHGGRTWTAVLDWSCPERVIIAPIHDESDIDSTDKVMLHTTHNFPLILVADPIYSPNHPTLLLQAISYHLSRDAHARVVIELPLREAFGTERQDLRNQMAGLGLVVIEEGEEVGYDDWTESGGELAEVRCWWGVWGWKIRQVDDDKAS